MAWTELAVGKLIDHSGRIFDSVKKRVARRASHLADQVEVDLRSNDPFGFRLKEQVPSIELWFSVYNFSNLDLVLDRLVVKICLSWAEVASGAISERIKCPRRKKTTNVLLRVPLNQNQATRFLESRETWYVSPRNTLTKATSNENQSLGVLDSIIGRTLAEPIELYVTAWFVSKTTKIDLPQRTIERRDVVCS